MPSPADSPTSPVGSPVGVFVAGGVVGGVVGVPVGVAEVVVADADGDVLVVGDDVGFEDCRLLVVGLADGVAVGAFESVPRLVLVP